MSFPSFSPFTGEIEVGAKAPASPIDIIKVTKVTVVVRRPSRKNPKSILSDGGECPEAFLKIISAEELLC